ncbi:glycosyltransferase family 2 protein [Halieaceae bacterium IMCC14734]|uniref:Glycosyltransferase family 2 protein n=1 Tax=Candidatus Litorirhabdus singularis TaxID=2518993 RepID=A0ABT3TBC8_9GAMM|nr:glycosyltransferase family 2 protein [Candidatus Litorirhabdus singularis]MCX2979598.1 glycosyltransferase family 2 protein [Candidatus Litorirhabdus singularis]
MSNPTLHILLSTYNGETYLEELLLSVLRQSYSPLQLHIRDDGSTDSTVNILQAHAAGDERISLQLGSNIGVQASFYSLLECVEDTTGVYAFCDQDDIWDSHKLEVAMRALLAAERPDATLYFARLSCVNANNQHLYDSDIPRAPGILNALVENSAIGCTCVFGNALRAEFLRGDPALMIMHDWWLYLCAASSGALVYDAVPHIRYRQHANTATPREPGLSRLYNRLRGLVARLGDRDAGLESLLQANHFMATYPEIDPQMRSTLAVLNDSHGMASFFKRLMFVSSTRLHRNNRLETLALKLVILCDLY